MWKRLPLALVIGLAIQAAFDTARVVHYVHGSDSWATWAIFEEGFDLASTALIMLGLFDLARGLRGRAALGARIAAWAQAAMLALFAVWVGLTAWSSSGHEWGATLKHIELATRYVSSLSILATTVGLWMATRNLALGIVGVVIAVVGIPVPVLGEWIGAHLALESKSGMLITMAPYAVLSCIWLAQVWSGARDVELPPASVPANLAFTRAAGALWLRVISACTLGGLTFFAALSGGIGLLDLLKGVTLLAPLVDAIALVLFARAALQLGRAGISPWRTTFAATCALFATGAIVEHLPRMYSMLYGDGHDFGELARDSSMMAYSITVPLVAGAALASMLIAVGQLARERNAEEVRENIAIRTGVFVVLTLGWVFVATYGIAHLPPSPGFVIFVLLALVCASFYTLVLAAKICAQGAELVERDPTGLPSATLVQRGGS
jgi:hypothetical protein